MRSSSRVPALVLLAGLTGCDISGIDKDAIIHWIMEQNEYTELEDEIKEAMLGLGIGGDEPDPEVAEEDAQDNLDEFEESEESEDVVGIDWRSVGGEGYINPVRDQGACGSCVAYAVSGVINAMARIGSAHPLSSGDQPDVSTGQLAFCGQEDICDTGWWPEAALEYALQNNVTSMDAYPYSATQQECDTALIDADQETGITGHQIIRTHARMIDWLEEVGPLVATMSVYEDFFGYTSGYYHVVPETAGRLMGGHAILIVGYGHDEASGQSYWIAQNSWSESWGDGGYFNIFFGEAGIDDRMYGATWDSTAPAWLGE